MKRILLTLLVSCNAVIYAQQYINVGSNKSDVKKIQGEPYSIQDYDVFGEEVWSYGENGVATITFKDGKVKSFRNYQQVLKIGNNSTLDKDNDEATSKEKLWSELTEKANSSGSTVTEETAKSNTDLYGSGSQNIKAYPNQYEEMAEAKGLNPYAMPDDITLQQMQKEYERKKYLKWGLITIGAIGILYLLFRMIIKKKHA
jgi:hypothetical protein